jgi:hypothetical protein
LGASLDSIWGGAQEPADDAFTEKRTYLRTAKKHQDKGGGGLTAEYGVQSRTDYHTRIHHVHGNWDVIVLVGMEGEANRVLANVL